MKIVEHKKDITVSICVITYNQENIIGQVLDYILQQQTNFKFEIVIGEDCSQDKTKSICKEFKKNHPESINLLLNEKNLGLIGNFSNVISQCSGKYIAVCAGDDFWINPLKLQKQVDFLNNNPNFSMCSCEAFYNKLNQKHNIRGFSSILYNNFKQDGLNSFFTIFFEFFQNKKTFWQKRRLPDTIKRPTVATLKTVLDDLNKSRYYPASANVFKREVVKQIPQEAFKYKAEHIIVIIWAAINGKIKLLSDVMVVKNELANSLTVNNTMHKEYNPKDNNKNYSKILCLAIEQKISDEKLLFINQKINELKQ
jgi:glycosyltransferase involved in cell wall biosynthesis